MIKYFRGKNNEIVFGEIEEGNLDFMLYHIKYYYWNSGKLEEQLTRKSAYMLHYLFTSHTFKDGNKRTGFVVTMLFLVLNIKPIKTKILDYASNIDTFKVMATRTTTNAKAINEAYLWLIENT